MAAIALEQPSQTDIDIIHPVLAQTYWSPGVPREIVAKAAANSICAIARDESGALIGFARLVTDRATFAWLCDVIVLPAHQGQGIARDLVRAFQAHPELGNLRRWLLGTRDAHGVYEKLGFSVIDEPHRFMDKRAANPYGLPTA